MWPLVRDFFLDRAAFRAGLRFAVVGLALLAAEIQRQGIAVPDLVQTILNWAALASTVVYSKKADGEIAEAKAARSTIDGTGTGTGDGT